MEPQRTCTTKKKSFGSTNYLRHLLVRHIYTLVPTFHLDHPNPTPQPRLAVFFLSKDVFLTYRILMFSLFSICITADQTKLIANISLNLSTTLEGAKEILPGHSYRIHAILSSSESNSTMAMYTQLNFEWELSTVDENTGQFSPFVILVDNAANITVTPDLPVGFTYVRVSAKPKAIIGAISYTFGFIRILPQLRAFVSGPNTAFKGGGPIELSVVTTGVLGTSFGIEAPNLEYIWSCRERNETTSNATFVAGYGSRFFNYTSAKGCFAYDPGISHSTNTQSVLINPDFMVAKRAYVFQVLVTQGKRSVVISHTIFVDTNLSFAIR